MTALLADLRKALISPNEDFVVIVPVSQEKTRVIGEEEINKIKQETSNIYLSDEDVVSHNQNHRDKFESVTASKRMTRMTKRHMMMMNSKR